MSDDEQQDYEGANTFDDDDADDLNDVDDLNNDEEDEEGAGEEDIDDGKNVSFAC